MRSATAEDVIKRSSELFFIQVQKLHGASSLELVEKFGASSLMMISCTYARW